MDKDAINCINDCYVEVNGVKPTQKVIERTYELLPDDIKGLAMQWGWNDTEVGDKVYRWLMDKCSIL